jgi:hypothetical protein
VAEDQQYRLDEYVLPKGEERRAAVVEEKQTHAKRKERGGPFQGWDGVIDARVLFTCWWSWQH